MNNLIPGAMYIKFAPWNNQKEIVDLETCPICGCSFDPNLGVKSNHNFEVVDICPECAKLQTCSWCGEKIQANEKAVKITEIDMNLKPLNDSEFIHVDCI